MQTTQKGGFNINIRTLDVTMSHQALGQSLFLVKGLTDTTNRHFFLNLEREEAHKPTLIEQECGPTEIRLAP